MDCLLEGKLQGTSVIEFRAMLGYHRDTISLYKLQAAFIYVNLKI